MPFNTTQVLKAFGKAVKVRQPREKRFDQAMRYAMPGRGSFMSGDPDDQIDDVFDETAIVATQEFASRLQSGITPNFSRWSKLEAGADIEAEDRDQVNDDLDPVTEFVFDIISQSNFSQESYETYMDLAVTLGCMEVEKGTVLDPLRFNAVPISELWVNNGPFDRLDQFFRRRSYDYEQFIVKYPDHKMPADKLAEWALNGRDYEFIEAVMRDWSDPNTEVHFKTVLCKECEHMAVFVQRYEGAGSCPMIAFRWSKEAGGTWGRGPLLNALPAIKTANLVVQMVLENAQLAIAGVYNMDDDGTVNVDTIQLVPGTIIPRSPGTRGLEAVQPAGNFNVADLILREQRDNIKRALYNDMLGNPNKTPMSATEVAERMADLARQIGAAFGRLMAEFIGPVMARSVFILKELGLITLPVVNGRTVKVTATSPLSQAQDQQDISNVDRWVEFVATRFGPQLVNVFVKGEEVAPYVANKLNVPAKLSRSAAELKGLVQQVSQQGGQVPGMTGEAPQMPGGMPQEMPAVA